MKASQKTNANVFSDVVVVFAARGLATVEKAMDEAMMVTVAAQRPDDAIVVAVVGLRRR
jgi:hypothetical protein